MNPLQGWRDRVTFSLIPVVVAVGTVLYHNSLVVAAGDGYSTFLYFMIILAVELETVFTVKTKGGPIRTMLILVPAVIIWTAFVFSRVAADSDPTQFPTTLLILALLGLPLSYWILKAHAEKSRRQFQATGDISRVIVDREKERVSRFKKDVRKSKIGDHEVDV